VQKPGNGFTLDLYGDKLITLAVNDQIAACPAVSTEIRFCNNGDEVPRGRAQI
jgi:hypothetical protein